jgi:hypothetical protein
MTCPVLITPLRFQAMPTVRIPVNGWWIDKVILLRDRVAVDPNEYNLVKSSLSRFSQPFNPFTTIRYKLSEQSLLKLRLTISSVRSQTIG